MEILIPAGPLMTAFASFSKFHRNIKEQYNNFPSCRCRPLSTMADVSTLLQSVIDLLDVLVELFLGFFVKPLVRLDNEVRVNMNEFLRKILDDNKRNIPQWLTAEFVAYARALLVIPTILLLAWDQFVLSAVLVVLVDLAGVLHCVVARFWVDAKRDLAEYAIRDDDRPITKAIASSENEEFDIYEFGTL